MAYIRKLPSGRWQATIRTPDGRRRTFSDRLKANVAQWARTEESSQSDAAARVRQLLAFDGAGIDPRGWRVYLLWKFRGAARPLYVGRSANILSRLGDHLGDSGKRLEVGWVTVVRCSSEVEMLRREAELIRRYRPPWNKHIPRESATPRPAA